MGGDVMMQCHACGAARSFIDTRLARLVRDEAPSTDGTVWVTEYRHVSTRCPMCGVDGVCWAECRRKQTFEEAVAAFLRAARDVHRLLLQMPPAVFEAVERAKWRVTRQALVAAALEGAKDWN